MPATYRRGKRRRSAAERAQMEREALERARSNPSWANFGEVISQFAARGIPADQISPKDNVFTYPAWRALGRNVRRGEKSVKITTYIPIEDKEQPIDPQTGKPRSRMRPVTSCVFHISQTEPIGTEPATSPQPAPEPRTAPQTPNAAPVEDDEHPDGDCGDPACEFCH